MATPDSASVVALELKTKLSGKILKTTLAGALVDIGQAVPGVIHISQLQKEAVNKVEDVVTEGQQVEVWVRRVKKDRIELTMIEPLACGVRGLGLIDIRPGHTVLILGCGISGILNIQLAKLKGARVVATDLNEYRLRKAEEFGADQVINAAQDLNLKADRVIICTGAYAAVEQAFRCIDKKGIIRKVFVGEFGMPADVIKCAFDKIN